MLNLRQLIIGFLNYLQNNSNIEIYNEYSLQYELAAYLHSQLNGQGYKVQIERPVQYFFHGINKNATVKHRIDISIYNSSARYAIELKYPTKGQYPEQMYAFVKDIKFIEELKNLGFNNTCVFTLVDDPLFTTGRLFNGIYQYFRNNPNTPISGTIKNLTLSGQYTVQWAQFPQNIIPNSRYYFFVI